MYDKFYALAELEDCGKWILDSHHLKNCNWIIGCDNLTNCFHCKDCVNGRNLFYCRSLDGVNENYSYYAFNAPVSRSRWEELKNMSHEELTRQPEYSANFDFNMINLNISK